MSWAWLESDDTPLMIAIAGPKSAGKTTFFHAHLAPSGLRFVNADVLARELSIDAYAAANIADRVRRELVQQRESFVFETVFSDPVGDKLEFMKQTAKDGYRVVLCFIGLEDASISDDRVAMRVTQGGHDVPPEKIQERFPRVLVNLKRAVRELPQVLVYDNTDLNCPFRLVVSYDASEPTVMEQPLPTWLNALTLE